MKHLRRRLFTLPALLLAAVVVILGLPLWLFLTWLLGTCVPRLRAAPRVILFLAAFICCEIAGVIASAWLYLRYGLAKHPATQQAFQEANYQLQFWWAERLKQAAARLFRLRFVVEGAENLGGPGVILMPRHCSMGDTLIPIIFYCTAHDRRLRYVLKRELLFDPCLDIVGNRLPNYFVDRGAADSDREVAGIRALASGLPEDHGILIYPEGTRFSLAKRDALKQRLAVRDPEFAARTASFDRVLPPRRAGPVGLLLANPGRDVVFCAHTGFEGSSSFATLFNGSWLDTEVRVKFWRIPYAEIPTDPARIEGFLLDQWERMNTEVARLMGSA